MEGTDSTAGLALAPHELLRAFNAQTLARGETYANQGRVVAARYDPVDGTLTGSCLGSKSEYYDVEVALSGPRTGLEIEYTVCTCPVGRYCKHAVALLLAAVPSAPDRAAPQRWQVVLGSLLDEMTGADTDAGGKPLALEFGMLPAGWYHTTPIATLRALTVGKRGNWIKSGINWRRLFDAADPGSSTGTSTARCGRWCSRCPVTIRTAATSWCFRLWDRAFGPIWTRLWRPA